MEAFDLLVVGGGINGAAVARDAAGRGVKVLLVERDDLGGHTSSASSKLIHGGLRYLEHYQLKLVRESLREREILLRTAPHLVRPLRFVLPHSPGGRPWWMIRLGLLGYDWLAGRSRLPRSRLAGRDEHELAQPLKRGLRLLTYWDAWTDDSRLVVANAVDAAARGAELAIRTELLSARPEAGRWVAELSRGRTVSAGTMVNAAGAWVNEVSNRVGVAHRTALRLVKGSHIVLPRLWVGDHAYILPQADGRIVFALPFAGFSLIGTTDVPVERPEQVKISPAEIDYLCAAANAYFARPIAPSDIIWSYAGVRALVDDGSAEAKDVTRDYRLAVAERSGAKLLSLLGGKLTTARAVAEAALDRLGIGPQGWTAGLPLPGGEPFDADRLPAWLPKELRTRLALAYGSQLPRLLGDASGLDDLGRHFGGGLYEAEVRFLIQTEFASTVEDILWRRTKLGLRLATAEQAALRDYLT